MAGILAALMIGGASEGIDKIKTKRAERKARRNALESPTSPSTSTASPEQASPTQEKEHRDNDSDSDDSKGNELAEAKAREAAEERSRASEGEGADLNTHPALRAPVNSTRLPQAEADAAIARPPPPPYVRDPPSYEEHVAKEEHKGSACG